MATITRLSEEESLELAMSDSDHNWELWDGVLVEKPPMSMKHDNVSFLLAHVLQSQLDWRDYRVNVNGGTTCIPRTFYIPDVVVIPATYQIPFEHDPRSINAFAEPLPFVAEVWSRATGDYDMAAKLPLYREPGDREIWFIHPYERTLTTWRIQPDGSYRENVYTSGNVSVESLPAVTIDLDALLDG